MRVARLLATAAVVAAAGLALATPALADAVSVPIHESQVPTAAAGFSKKECSGPLIGLPSGKDGWHFVTTGQSSFTSVTLKFHTAGADVTATIAGSAASPSTGPGWTGWLDNAGSAEKHAYLIADAGWVLFAGDALVENVSRDGAFFNLSHTCPAKNQSSGSPSPSTSASTPNDTPTPDPSASPGGGGGGNLPRTGTATGVFIVSGIALVGGGIALLAVRRRRDTVRD